MKITEYLQPYDNGAGEICQVVFSYMLKAGLMWLCKKSNDNLAKEKLCAEGVF
jgi:hypothetical protein